MTAALNIASTRWLGRAITGIVLAGAVVLVGRAIGGGTSPDPSPATPAPSTSVPAAAPGSGQPQLGVLAADPTHLAADRAIGVRQVTVSLGWNEWEPTPGHFDGSYRSAMRSVVGRYRAAGMSVAVDLGLQYPPRWTSQLSGGRLLDQHGGSAGPADLWWSRATRNAASAYLANVVSSLGPVSDYRVGLSENGEALYPDTSSNQWWAFTPDAQGKVGGLPAGLSPTPMPGWVPGTSSWRGQSVTTAQVTSWYDWYFGGEVSALSWEISSYRAAGYHGQLELVMPGTGSLPAFYQERLDAFLADGKASGQHYDDLYTLNTAAVWWRLLDDLPDLTGVAVDISSVDDGSGDPRANPCTPADASVALDDQATWAWSDTRWLSYLAALHDLPVLGENPGGTPSSELHHVLALATSCHLRVLQWAFDDSLYTSGRGASASQVGRAFAAASGRGGGTSG